MKTDTAPVMERAEGDFPLVASAADEQLVSPAEIHNTWRDRAQTARVERKFFIPFDRVDDVKSIIAGTLVPDEFTKITDGRGYPVHTIYLDSERLAEAERMAGNRSTRLRFRLYDGDFGFAEIKEKEKDTRLVEKIRSMISLPDIERFCQTLRAIPERALVVQNDTQLENLAMFNRVCRLFDVRATTMASYIRRGWELPEGNAERLTLDTDLRSRIYDGSRSLDFADRKNWALRDVPGVIMEAKYVDPKRPPLWLSEIIETIGVQETKFKKHMRQA